MLKISIPRFHTFVSLIGLKIDLRSGHTPMIELRLKHTVTALTIRLP